MIERSFALTHMVGRDFLSSITHAVCHDVTAASQTVSTDLAEPLVCALRLV